MLNIQVPEHLLQIGASFEQHKLAFTIHVTELFLKYGQIEPNQSALQAFLESVREDMGQQDQAENERILSEIQSLGNDTGNNSIPKPMPPQS